MPLDSQMSKLRQSLSEHEQTAPAGFERFLPRRDGRPGKCFEEAEQIVLDADCDAGLVLVHGKCRAPNGRLTGHAWVEVPTGLVYDAVLGRVYLKKIYEEKLQAVAQKRYSATQVAALARTTDNYGPWTEAEEQRAFTLGQKREQVITSTEYEELVSRVARKVRDGVATLQDGAIGFGKSNRIEGASGFPHQIDVSVNAKAVLLIAECKHWKYEVDPEALLAFSARFLDIKDRLNNLKKVAAAVATTKGFGPGAEQLAKYFGVELWAVAGEEEFVCRMQNVLSVGLVNSAGIGERIRTKLVPATLQITQERVLETGKRMEFALEDHVRYVYDVLRFHGDSPPAIMPRQGESRPAVQQVLLDWKADLGARDRTNWKDFLARHQSILLSLANLSRLGQLSDADIGLVCSVVQDLESFKDTQSRKLVFGSKAAHIHFPWLVPVMSSEVRKGLQKLEKHHSTEMATRIGGETPKFRFTTGEECLHSFRQYVVLGNSMCRDLDSKALLALPSLGYDLHAKVFEWWVISHGLPNLGSV